MTRRIIGSWAILFLLLVGCLELGGCGQGTIDEQGQPVVDNGYLLSNSRPGATASCGVYDPPDMTSCCHACTVGSGNCQANACYGGYWCNHSTCRCSSPPTNCGTDGGADAGVDAGMDAGVDANDAGHGDAGQADAGSDTYADAGDQGPADTGSVDQWIGPNGGTVDLLKFAVFGDVRPSNSNLDSGYPSSIVRSIFTKLAARNPQMVLGVGDWMFASTQAHARTQLDTLLQAEQPYGHTVFHAMGNHECSGYTSDACPSANETVQARAYMSKLLTFSSVPYFSFNVQTSHGLAKFVVTAPNAWSNAQETWLRSVMSQPSTYTFVLRHEPPSANTAPGMSTSESIIMAYHNTLLLYGHTHEYRRLSTNQVITGNGGAPLVGSYYGYLMVEQLSNGNIKVTEYRQTDDKQMATFTLTPDGNAANY